MTIRYKHCWNCECELTPENVSPGLNYCKRCADYFFAHFGWQAAEKNMHTCPENERLKDVANAAKELLDLFYRLEILIGWEEQSKLRKALQKLNQQK